MDTVCHKQLIFEKLFSKEVIADFDGGRITSNAGGMLLRELDQRYRIAEKTASCLRDPRDSGKVKHDLLTLMRQRVFGIALGYEDNNDATWLSKDPALKTMAGKAPESACDLPPNPPYPCGPAPVNHGPLMLFHRCSRGIGVSKISFLFTSLLRLGPKDVIGCDVGAPFDRKKIIWHS